MALKFVCDIRKSGFGKLAYINYIQFEALLCNTTLPAVYMRITVLHMRQDRQVLGEPARAHVSVRV